MGLRTQLNSRKFEQDKAALILGFCLLLINSTYCDAQKTNEVSIIDARHYSNVFGETRNYRIFLPPGYADNPRKKYPVIYFLHGWSQRSFGSSNSYADFDKGNENNGDNIANFVSKHDVIVVKSDGYNAGPDEKYYVRPYNIGPVETYRQFPIYFPELIGYIDAHYRTIANREHRAISGLSMGGFMTFWIGGKYPDLFSAAGSFCGSPEFVVGPKNFPVEYRHIDMYKNFAGMNVRLNYGDKDFIRGYHQDMNRIWPNLMNNYESRIYDAEHSTCGLSDMFGFLMKTFSNPPSKPEKWRHTDVYPEFSIWDYQVSSDRNVPGFTVLENVDKRGFRCSVKEFVPDGELMPFVNVSVTTPPLYEKNKAYVINDVDSRNLKVLQKTILSDSTGRLKVSMNGGQHEIGINKTPDKPNICIATVETQNMSWPTHKKEVRLAVKLLNKGLSAGRNIIAKLSVTRNSAMVIQSQSAFGNIGVNEIKNSNSLFSFKIQLDSIEVEKFKLTIHDGNKNEWVDFFEIPIKKDVPEITGFEIADGKKVIVAKGGVGSDTLILGNGNADGIANPGESIVLLVKDKDKYWRTDLFVSDRFVNPFGFAERKSDYWGDFDHVGASAKYDIPLIASDCPENHNIQFFAEYWLPEYPLHIIKQAMIKITVKVKDKTAPKISWVQIPVDNVVQAKVNDGSKLRYVKAKLTATNDPSKSFTVELKDDGLAGDAAEGDNVFSKKISEQKFGLYKVTIEAMDLFGNKIVEEAPGEFVVY